MATEECLVVKEKKGEREEKRGSREAGLVKTLGSPFGSYADFWQTMVHTST